MCAECKDGVGIASTHGKGMQAGPGGMHTKAGCCQCAGGWGQGVVHGKGGGWGQVVHKGGAGIASGHAKVGRVSWMCSFSWFFMFFCLSHLSKCLWCLD